VKGRIRWRKDRVRLERAVKGSYRWTSWTVTTVPAMTLPGYFWDRWPYFTGKLSSDITTTQVNSALHPSGVAKSSTSFGWGKGGKVTSAGWQVTLCDLIWHVISRSGVVISNFDYELLYPVYFYFLKDGRCLEGCRLKKGRARKLRAKCCSLGGLIQACSGTVAIRDQDRLLTTDIPPSDPSLS